jgi:hypothetical protein
MRDEIRPSSLINLIGNDFDTTYGRINKMFFYHFYPVNLVVGPVYFLAKPYFR